MLELRGTCNQGLINFDSWIFLGEFVSIISHRGSSIVADGRLMVGSKTHHSQRGRTMKRMLLVLLMLLVAGTAYAATNKKSEKCNVNGTIQWVETADACKTLGGTVENPFVHHASGPSGLDKVKRAQAFQPVQPAQPVKKNSAYSTLKKDLKEKLS